MTSADVNSLKLDNDDVTMYSGSTVFYMLREYSDRYMICEDKDEFLYKWATYTSYKLPDFIKAYDAVYSNYNPLENYSKHETKVKTIDDGDTTHTHTPDSEHNTTTTTNSYNTYTENTQDSVNKPTTEHYVSTFEAAEKLESKDISSGTSTVHNYTDDDTNTTYTDDLKYTNTESHTTVTKSIDNTSYTADRIEFEKNDISGLNNTSNQQLIKDSVELAKHSLIYAFIYEFISKYTFYAFGGDEYVL